MNEEVYTSARNHTFRKVEEKESYTELLSLCFPKREQDGPGHVAPEDPSQDFTTYTKRAEGM